MAVLVALSIALSVGATEPTSVTARHRAPTVADSIHPVWQGFVPDYREAPCPFEVTRAPTRVGCGYVLVPQDRSDPQSHLIRLAVLRVDGANPAPDRTVVHVAGGPGGSAIEFLYRGDGARDELLALAAEGDLILVDTRGTGFSEPAICRGLVAGIPSEEAELRFRAAMRQCLSTAEQRGIALHALSTWHQAHDLRDVRRALGLERWNLWALSYGTRLAGAVMQVDSGGVRSVILDSTSPPRFPTSLAAGLKSALDAVGRACQEIERCSRDVGDLSGRLIEAVASYDAQPLEITGLDEHYWPGGRIEIDGNVVASSLLGGMYSSSNYDDLPQLLHILESRDYETIRATVERGGSEPDPSWGAAMTLVTVCRWDVPSLDSLRAWRAAHPVVDRWLIETDFGRSARDRCQDLYTIDPDPSVRPLASGIPTLLLSGLADPITPPSFVQSVAVGLGRSTLIQVPHTGHNVIGHLNGYATGCGTELMHSFFADPERQAEIPCASAIRPPEFLTRVRETPRLSRFLQGVAEGDRPIWPAAALVGLLLVAISYPLGATVRLIDGRSEPGGTRVRYLSWIGSGLTLAAAGFTAAILFQMVRQHPIAISVGWLQSVALAGWLCLFGLLVSAAAVARLFVRSQTPVPRSTAIGAFVGMACSFAFFAFLLTVGAGPL